jgi:hypothetical protein
LFSGRLESAKIRLMGGSDLLDVDPQTLHLPPSRAKGADPWKLQRQIAQHGTSTLGMPRLTVFRASDGALVIYDGVTRATRVAKLLPGQTVPVEIIGDLPSPGAKYPTIKDRLP